MRRKYLVLLLIPLVIMLSGCGKKKHFAPPPEPGAPSSLTAIPVSSTQIDLSWKDNSTDEKGFYVYRRTTDDYSRVANMEANATSYSDNGLSPETTYRYKVRAYNDTEESSASNEVSITTLAGLTPPLPLLQPPSNVMAEAISYKQINLSWQDNSGDEDSFRIACDLGIGQNQFLDRVPANTTHYEHYKLQPMTYYQYFVIAERGGESAASERFATTTSCPVTTRAYGVQYLSDTLVEVWGDVYSSADEPCRAELTAFIYDFRTWDLIATNKETFELKARGMDTFYIKVELPGTQHKVYYKVEVTDVEIEY